MRTVIPRHLSGVSCGRLLALSLIGVLVVLAVNILLPAEASAQRSVFGPFEIHARHSDRCLDVAHKSTAHAGDVIQGTCTHATNQQWSLRGSPNDGFYEVVALHSGMCLDVAHNSTAHAANVIQGTCSRTKNQQWTLVALDTDGGVNGRIKTIPAQGGVKYRLKARHSNMCLDVAHMSIAHAADVIQGTCWSPGYNQQWLFTRPPQ